MNVLSISRLIAPVLTCIGFSELSIAAVVTIPPDLTPGDTYRLIFVTSSTRDAASGDIADYNAFVSDIAGSSTLSQLGADWTAIGSTDSVSARENIGSFAGSISRLDGTRVAHSTDDLWDGSILAPVLLTESGQSLPLPLVWTGTRTDGAISTFPLGSGGLVSIGSPRATDFQWIDQYPTPFFAEHHFYGISSALTVPVAQIPEPATIALVVSGAGLMVALRRKGTLRTPH